MHKGSQAGACRDKQKDRKDRQTFTKTDRQTDKQEKRKYRKTPKVRLTG